MITVRVRQGRLVLHCPDHSLFKDLPSGSDLADIKLAEHEHITEHIIEEHEMIQILEGR